MSNSTRDQVAEAFDREFRPSPVPPGLRPRAVHAATVTQPQPVAGRGRGIVLVAGGLLLAVITIAVGARLFPLQTPVVPEATPSPVSAFNCTLPVIVGNGLTGFVNTSTGAYRGDAKVSTAGLPGFGRPLAYDPAVERWLPVLPSAVSPDGLAYVYVRLAPGSLGVGQARRYDLLTGADSPVWNGLAQTASWSKTGIYIWQRADFYDAIRIDPLTGNATRIPQQFKPLAGDPPFIGSTAVDNIGATVDGQSIWWYFNRSQPGGVDWVFYETAPGVRVYIFKGTENDTTGFDPGTAASDRFGVWFSDLAETQAALPAVSQTLWHWDAASGLRKLTVTHLPNVSGVVPSGPCF